MSQPGGARLRKDLRVPVRGQPSQNSRGYRVSNASLRGCAPRLVLDQLVLLDLSVANMDDPVRMHGDIVLMGDEYDGIPVLVQTLEYGHDFIAGGGIEVSGRLIGQQD